MLQISKYFTLEEFTFSQTAQRFGINNYPGMGLLSVIIRTAEKLDSIRELLNAPIRISSGYRCPTLNMRIGSNSNSQHIKGEAVDFTSNQFGSPRQIVKEIINSNIVFDQLILEFDSWVHISFVESNNRNQALIINNQGTRIFS